MKKLYFLSLLCCFGFAAFAQTTVTIYATGATGSYITGTATNFGGGTRADGNISSSSNTTRGYAVFDLSSIPAGATVTSVVVGFNVSGYFGGGAPSGWNTYGYVGDLSLVTVATTLFGDMVAGTSLSTATYGVATGNQTLASTAASTTFVQTNAGSKISVCWTGGGTKTYIITGETGAAATIGAHAPYLKITYQCAGVSGVSASATPNPLCVGSTLNLTGVATGATSYSWSGPGPYASASQSPSLITTAASAGVYTFTAYNASGCGTQASTAAVVLSATPAAAITPNTTQVICAGNNVVLTGTAGVGYTYQWSQAGTAISGATSQTYTASTNGSYTVFITNTGTGCSATSAPVVVSVIPLNPPLIPANNGVVCIGSNLTLAVNLSGATTGIAYQWEIGGVAIPGGTNSTYTTASAGVYNCVLTLPGCSTTTQPTTITVLPLPTPAITYGSGILKTGSTYASYQWFLNLVAIPGATDSILAAPSNGSYRVRVTTANGCSNYSSSYALNNLSVTQVNNSPTVRIYPNPASQKVHIESSVSLRAVITSIEGKKLMEQPNVTDMNISGLPNGLYLIMLYDEAGERVAIDKLIKE